MGLGGSGIITSSEALSGVMYVLLGGITGGIDGFAVGFLLG